MSGVVKEWERAQVSATSRGVDVVPEGDDDNRQLDDQQDAPKDRWFNAYRYPRSEAAKAVVRDVTGQLQVYENRFKLRARARKKADQETFEATVSAIISDLISHYVTGDPNGVVITRSNQLLGVRSRYRPLAYGKTLPTILDRLAAREMSFVRQEVGGGQAWGPARSTTIYPGERLITRIHDHDLGPEDLGVQAEQEAIVLKRTKEDYWDKGDYQEYDDTEDTRCFRAEMQRINRFLRDAPLGLDKSVLKASKYADIEDRQLRRVFTRGRFDSGGRLFGGFWQNLSKKERFEGLDINGDSVVSLDYSQMGLRIAYGLVNATPPERDGYTLPGLEANREAVKKLFNSVLFAEKPLTRLPKGLGALLPKDAGLPLAMELLMQAHPELTPLFHTGVGHKVQFVESQILVRVLLQAQELDIVALPVHDAIIVADHDADEAEGLMREVFEERTGVLGVVQREEPKEALVYDLY